jgi:MoaA/NifB/PqqE/SkfB family radical SAM enzyme
MTFPTVELRQLDELWFQITGTRCNLRCTHCFISCAPDNTSFGDLDVPTVARMLGESRRHGVKEYYFTGGEPFLHPQMLEILEMTLAIGPATVLTNGTIMTGPMVERLGRMRDASAYSLELRISIDHFDEAKNDAIRGEGSYRRALKGARRLGEAGFLPIVTAMRTWDIDEDLSVLEEMSEVLKAAGVPRPRIKFLPSLKIGAEAQRTGGYSGAEFVTEEMMEDFPQEQLICSHSRIVTDRGVHVCPILIESRDSVLGQTLEEASRGYTLRHQACSTCYLFGSICTNAASSVRESSVAPGRRK